MRLLKLILTAFLAAIAVIGGLVVTAIVTVVTLTVFAARRALSRPRPQQSPNAQAGQHRPRRMSHPDAIDISATEVPVDRAAQ